MGQGPVSLVHKWPRTCPALAYAAPPPDSTRPSFSPASRMCSNAIFLVRLSLLTPFQIVVLLTQPLSFSRLYSSDKRNSLGLCRFFDCLCWPISIPQNVSSMKGDVFFVCVCLFWLPFQFQYLEKCQALNKYLFNRLMKAVK